MSYVGRHRAPAPPRRRAPYVREVATLTGVAVAATLGNVVWHALPAHADPDWTPVIQCESGGNPTAQNPSSTASGLFQFLDTSWLAYGGGQYAPRAKDATPAQQTAIANRAYAQAGLIPWAASRSCWGGKVSTGNPVTLTAASTPRHAAPSRPAVPLPSTAAPRHAASGTYTVQAGDTLSVVAASHGLGDWGSLYDLNRDVIGGDPDMILPGQVLTLPG